VVHERKTVEDGGKALEASVSNKMSNMEKKRERFVRIAERRVNKLLSDFDSLAKCANKKNYQYTAQDVRAIFGELEGKLKEIRLLFKSSDFTPRRFTLRP
jgi:hypothetical protein